MDLKLLRVEIEKDPEGIGYISAAANARKIDPDDKGVSDVAIADLINTAPRPGKATTADAEAIIASFTPDEWAAAKNLSDTTIDWWRDRLLTRRDPISLESDSTFGAGVQFLVARGVLKPERLTQITESLSASAQAITRAVELGFGYITPSDVANARRLDPQIELGE